jgi:hypothetical protein
MNTSLCVADHERDNLGSASQVSVKGHDGYWLPIN